MDASASRHRGLPRAALALALIVMAGETIVGVSTGLADPLGGLLAGVISLPFGFLLTYGLLLLEDRYRSRRAARRTVPAVAPSAPTPFAWRGRSWRSLVFLSAFAVLFAGLELSTEWMWADAGRPPNPAFIAFFRGAWLVMFGMIAVASAFSLKAKTVLVDESGVHVRGRLWGDFDMSWPEVGQVGVTSLVPDFYRIAKADVTPKAFAFQDRDGRFRGILNPGYEMSTELEAGVAGSVRGFATRYGIPMRDVSFREFTRWKRRPARHA